MGILQGMGNNQIIILGKPTYLRQTMLMDDSSIQDPLIAPINLSKPGNTLPYFRFRLMKFYESVFGTADDVFANKYKLTLSSSSSGTISGKLAIFHIFRRAQVHLRLKVGCGSITTHGFIRILNRIGCTISRPVQS